MISLLGRAILAVGPCFSWLWIFLANPFQPSKFIFRNQLIVLWRHPIGNCFFLAVVKILSLSLIFGILIMMCLGVGLFVSILFGTFCASWTHMSNSFTKLQKFCFIIFSNRFPILAPSLLLLVSLWGKCYISWSCPRGSLHYPHFFWILSSCCSDWLFFYFLIFQVTDLILIFFHSTVVSQ